MFSYILFYHILFSLKCLHNIKYDLCDLIVHVVVVLLYCIITCDIRVTAHFLYILAVKFFSGVNVYFTCLCMQCLKNYCMFH